jgi:predicted dehydrogenase
MENDRILRVGIIGSGGMAAARAERVADLPDLALVAVTGRNSRTCAALAERYGVRAIRDWRELVTIDDLDAVFVTTHPDTHAEMALAALEQGRNVFLESTLAITVADADAVAEAARSRGLVVRVGHTRVLRPVSLVVAEQVERLGGPVLDDVRIQSVNDLRRGRVEGFDMRITGHPFLYAITLGLPAVFGRGRIASIRASARIVGNGPVFESCVATTEIVFESGVVANIAYLRGFDWTGPGWRTVACQNGSVRVVDTASHVEVTTAGGMKAVPIPEADPWRTEIEEFVGAIRTGAPMTVTLDDARRVVAIAEAAERASSGPVPANAAMRLPPP